MRRLALLVRRTPLSDHDHAAEVALIQGDMLITLPCISREDAKALAGRLAGTIDVWSTIAVELDWPEAKRA